MFPRLPAHALFVALLLTTLSIAAQRSEPAKRAKTTPATRDAKPEDERTKRGKTLLSQAEAEAGGLEGEMRAYALLQAARAYAAFDATKAKELLDQAYAASQVNHDDSPSKTRVVQQILVNIAQISPERAEELLPYAPREIRADVLNALLGYYRKNKQFERATEIVLRIARESEFPYAAAAALMTALPKGDSDSRQAIFTAALTSFKTSNANRPRLMLGMNDLGTLLVRFWQNLPASLVREAIDALLDQAERKGSEQARPMRIAISRPSGSSSFNSLYEYRLQQVLPILRKIDEAEAKRLAETLKQLNPSLAPAAGIPAPDEPGGRAGKNSLRGIEVRMGDGLAAPGNESAASARMLQMQRAEAVQKLAYTNPQDALAQASALEPEARLTALEGIARVTIKTDSSIARKALEQSVASLKSVNLEFQAMHVEYIVDFYLRMGDKEAAKRTIEQGAQAVAKQYQQDSDKDNGNQALKAYWPSAGAWQRLIRLSARISPDFAASLVDEIPDPEIKATQRLALAGDLLGVPSDRTATIISHKGQPTQMSIEVGDGEDGMMEEEVSER